MKSDLMPGFRTLLKNLPKGVQQQALAAYRQFKQNPFHPSLHFKRVGKGQPIYSVRIGLNYRALGLRDPDDQITWYWIGTHAEYDKLVDRF